MNLIARTLWLILLTTAITGCTEEKQTTSKNPEVDNQEAQKSLVDNHCKLERGVVFENCISSKWQFPSYYYMPFDGSPGQEISTAGASDRFVRAEIIDSGDEKNRVLDVEYRDDSANALFRFRVSENQSYPADLRDFRAGALEFDLRVLDWGAASGIGIRVECGWPCATETIALNIDEVGRWQSFRISAQELVSKGLDLSKLDSAVNFVPTWDRMQDIHFQLDNLRWVKGEQNAELPYRPSKDWSALALEDLTFIYETALENHPGAIDAQNPEFREYLDSGYQEAKALAETASSRSDYKTALSYYMAGFADGHFAVGFTEKEETLLWPGFNVQKNGDSYIVRHRDPEAWEQKRPELGSILISCDRREAAELMEDDVLRYVFRDDSVDAMKWQYSWKLFAKDEIGNRNPYQRCQFKSNGEIQSYNMHWQAVSRERVFGKQNSYSYPSVSTIEKLDEDLYWVYLPTFLDLRGDEITSIEGVAKKLESLPELSTVVFDMRFNGGGNSQWGFDLLGALHGELSVGKAFYDATADSYAEFRVSQGNADFYREKAKDQTLARQSRELMEERYQGINAALNDDKDWYQEGGNGWLRTILSSMVGVFVNFEPEHRTVLLTSPNCASACLDFADLALLIPEAVHIGQETAADTHYVDIRSPAILLPSQQARLTLPMKVWRNRLREHNESYVPDYIFEGNIKDTKAVQEWVLQNVSAWE